MHFSVHGDAGNLGGLQNHRPKRGLTAALAAGRNDSGRTALPRRSLVFFIVNERSSRPDSVRHNPITARTAIDGSGIAMPWADNCLTPATGSMPAFARQTT